MTPGVFTDSAIANIIVNEKNLLRTSRMTELAIDITSGVGILSNMDSTIKEIGSGTSCMGAKVFTLRSGSLDKGNKTMACTLSSTVKDGTDGLQLQKQALVNFENFAIEDILCDNQSDFETRFSYLYMKAKVSLEQKITKALIALASANADVPVAGQFDIPGTVTGSVYQVATANFTSNLLGDLKYVAKKNKMVDPRIYNGRNFYVKSIMNEFESNGCCSNDAILNSNKHFDIIWDIENVDAVTGQNSTLIIDKNSILFWSSPVYDKSVGFEDMMTKGKTSNDHYWCVDKLPRLTYNTALGPQPIYVDVRAKRGCVLDSLGVARDAWVFELYVYGDMRMNLPNQDGKLGVYRIDKVA